MAAVGWYVAEKGFFQAYKSKNYIWIKDIFF